MPSLGTCMKWEGHCGPSLNLLSERQRNQRSELNVTSSALQRHMGTRGGSAQVWKCRITVAMTSLTCDWVKYRIPYYSLRQKETGRRYLFMQGADVFLSYFWSNSQTLGVHENKREFTKANPSWGTQPSNSSYSPTGVSGNHLAYEVVTCRCTVPS